MSFPAPAIEDAALREILPVDEDTTVRAQQVADGIVEALLAGYERKPLNPIQRRAHAGQIRNALVAAVNQDRRRLTPLYRAIDELQHVFQEAGADTPQALAHLVAVAAELRGDQA